MPTTRTPRKGSLQYWPRKRAKRQHARVRSWNAPQGKVAGFAGYKAGMTHVLVTDNRKNSPTKGQDISMPATIIECPPLTIAGVRLYRKANYGTEPATEVRFENSKDLERAGWKKSGSLEKLNAEDYLSAQLLVATQPAKTGIGQKTPQVFEMAYGGSVEDVINFAKEHTEITVQDALEAGQFIDTHSVTTGKGTQGAVKRMGISLRSHKSEKSVRKAVIAPEGYAKVQYTAPMAGKMGYNTRTEYNKQVIGIVDAEQVQIDGGILKYGQVKNTALLVKGSVGGPKKRLITFGAATRPDPKASTQPMEIVHIATRSQQGNQ